MMSLCKSFRAVCLLVAAGLLDALQSETPPSERETSPTSRGLTGYEPPTESQLFKDKLVAPVRPSNSLSSQAILLVNYRQSLFTILTVHSSNLAPAKPCRLAGLEELAVYNMGFPCLFNLVSSNTACIYRCTACISRCRAN